MFIDPLVWLFIGAFGSWLILGLVYGFNAPRPEPPAVRIVTRGHIRVKIVPPAYRPPAQMPMGMTPDEFYKGCQDALLNALSKEAKDNL